MSRTDTQYEIAIRPLKIRFWIAAALFLVVAMAAAQLARTQRLQEKTYSELVRAKGGFDKLKDANSNRRQALAVLKAQLGNRADKNSPESVIYTKLDEIKERLRPDDLTVTAIERKGGEVSLPYTLKFNNYDYNRFLNAISYLQEGILPLTPVHSVTITQADDSGKGMVLFTITGKVLTNQKSKP